MFKLEMFDIGFVINICYIDTVQLLISYTAINQYQYMWRPLPKDLNIFSYFVKNVPLQK